LRLPLITTLLSGEKFVSSHKLRIAIASALAIQLPAQAQERIQEIEIVGREVNLVCSALSASEGRVSHNEILQRPLLRTGEVLESVPGLVATQHSGSGKANQFFLRGFNLDHGTDFATSVDGMPVNMRSHGHGQGYTDLNFLIPELVEEVVYRKGSYYADVGDFSGAGAARIYSRDHSLDNSINLGAGEYGFGRLLATGSLDSLQGDLVYGLEHQVYEGPWDSIDEDIGKTNLWLKQIWQGDDQNVALSFMLYDNEWNSADQIPARAVSSGQISQFGSIDPTVGGSSSRYSLALNWQRNLGWAEWQSNAYVIDYDMELYSNFSYFISPQGDQFQQVDERRIYGGDTALVIPGQWGDVAVINTLGAELRIDDIDQVGLRATAQRQFLDEIRLDAVDESSVSLYWQSEQQWSPRLRSVLGLRYDTFDFEVNALAAGDPSTLAANSGEADDDIVTASLSLMYAVNDNHELYASIGEGFHSNDARGTTIRLDPVEATDVQPVDPLVSTLGSEIGWRMFLTDQINATVALWQLDIDSELLFVGDAGNTEDTGVGSERQGVELTTYYQLNDAVGLDFEYSWTDAAFETAVDGSDAIPGALEHVISAGINIQPNDQFFAHLRLRSFDDFPLDGGVQADGSTLLNLRLGYEFSEALSVALDVLNLTDSDDHDIEYFYESQLMGELAPVEDRHFHVFEPRSLRLYLDYRF
jgi:outer membrane receptor protein involved in Fe transport